MEVGEGVQLKDALELRGICSIAQDTEVVVAANMRVAQKVQWVRLSFALLMEAAVDVRYDNNSNWKLVFY